MYGAARGGEAHEYGGGSAEGGGAGGEGEMADGSARKAMAGGVGGVASFDGKMEGLGSREEEQVAREPDDLPALIAGPC